MDEQVMSAEEVAKDNRRLQSRLRKMLREAGQEGPLDIRYIRHGWGERIVCAAVFKEGSDEPSILVVDQRRDGWLWVVDRWS